MLFAQKRREKTINEQIALVMIAFSFVFLLFTVGTAVAVGIQRDRDHADAIISSTAAYVAGSADVIDMLEAGYPNAAVSENLQRMESNYTELQVIDVVDSRGVRYYHTSRAEGGENIVSGEEKAILAGGEPYITRGRSTNGEQRRAYQAVVSRDGVILGYVMVSVFVSQLGHAACLLIGYGVILFGAAFLASIFASQYVAARLEASLQGHTPAEMVALYQQQKNELADELASTRNALDTLRAVNHEFMNKLHIILGYLETGQTRKAVAYITNTSRVTSEIVRQTADCLRVSDVCALVIGKMMHAAECGFTLTLAQDSSCREEDLPIPSQDLVTLVGNLLENAIEELKEAPGDDKEIRLALYCRPGGTLITCEDTGRGIAPEVAGRLFEKGVTSKGSGHGLGLYLVKGIIDKYSGQIELESEPGAGTAFIVSFERREANGI